jgi:hypothetical protein
MLTIDPTKIKIKKSEINADMRKKLQDFLKDDVSSITSQFKKLQRVIRKNSSKYGTTSR